MHSIKMHTMHSIDYLYIECIQFTGKEADLILAEAPAPEAPFSSSIN